MNPPETTDKEDMIFYLKFWGEKYVDKQEDKDSFSSNMCFYFLDLYSLKCFLLFFFSFLSYPVEFEDANCQQF